MKLKSLINNYKEVISEHKDIYIILSVVYFMLVASLLLLSRFVPLVSSLFEILMVFMLCPLAVSFAYVSLKVAKREEVDINSYKFGFRNLIRSINCKFIIYFKNLLLALIIGFVFLYLLLVGYLCLNEMDYVKQIALNPSLQVEFINKLLVDEKFNFFMSISMYGSLLISYLSFNLFKGNKVFLTYLLLEVNLPLMNATNLIKTRFKEHKKDVLKLNILFALPFTITFILALSLFILTTLYSSLPSNLIYLLTILVALLFVITIPFKYISTSYIFEKYVADDVERIKKLEQNVNL